MRRNVSGNGKAGARADFCQQVLSIYRKLAEDLDRLEFSSPVACVYNPLVYAREPFEDYVRRYVRERVPTVLLGMNPGPFGMVQTGVPFGEVSLVREWLGIGGKVEKPACEHPKRPVLGFDCARSEVSGRRLWGWAKDTFGEPDRFFSSFCILNYCPLAFMEESGRNITPEKIRAEERDPLLELCDKALYEVIALLRPERIIGVGGFAEKRAQVATAALGVKIGRMLHPSPQNPVANREWASRARADLARCGVEL